MRSSQTYFWLSGLFQGFVNWCKIQQVSYVFVFRWRWYQKRWQTHWYDSGWHTSSMNCIYESKWRGGRALTAGERPEDLRADRAGILWWDGGMSHMLSMSCLCVYLRDGCVKMLWVIAIWAGLQIYCPLLPPSTIVLQDELHLVGRKSLLLRQASPPATTPFPPTLTAVL